LIVEEERADAERAILVDDAMVDAIAEDVVVILVEAVVAIVGESWKMGR
jgi:hypothetical protein